MSRARVGLTFAVCLALLGACSLTLPFDDLDRDPPLDAALDTADAPTDASEAGTDGGGDAEASVDTGDAETSTCANKALDPDEADVDCGGSCPGKCGSGKKCKVPADCLSTACEAGKCLPCPAMMVRVPIGTAFYCVDASEVTVAAYQDFATKVAVKDVAALPATCKWKTSFVAAVGGAADEPIRGVDWCDAWAYCDTAGKRLCGAIGPGGASKPPSPFDKLDDPNVDQWRHACAYGGSPVWPYGTAAQPTKCNTSDRLVDAGPGDVVPVRSLSGCNGGSSGAELATLYDMSGNVAEWTDSCQSALGASDPCRVRGGSFREKASSAACGVAMSRSRSDRQDWVGFRCCRF
ncbi:MAG: SUMF1/EgtB/PvdO family nonheme iron enzyme [Myxococcales bacterium]|nr:SUMF1/EgtB/PvdO family nonheme iron enzyme [Myxococcales bacterium]